MCRALRAERGDLVTHAALILWLRSGHEVWGLQRPSFALADLWSQCLTFSTEKGMVYCPKSTH